MLKEKAALFTIGQFAALHEINKKTLMWYDEIGLLKPACIKENGYRYYSYQQSAALETILMYLLMKSNNLWKTVPLITSLLFCKKKSQN